MTSLEGKVAFITGAARGQGRSHAIRLAREGADIVALDLCADIDSVPYALASAADLDATVAAVEDLGRRVLPIVADVRDEQALIKAAEEGSEALGGIDIVLANAGVAPMTVRPHLDEWRDVIDINLSGVQYTLSACAPHLIRQGRGGAIVITSSTQGLTGVGTDAPGALAYTAAKHAIVGLMRSYANFLAPHRVRVNTIHPTGVATDMVLNSAMQEYLQALGVQAGGGNALPVPMIEASDVSDAIAWLVSDEARYVTGVALPVDAGYTNKK